jgi:tRNA A-37 threonylcarbamoyl transferase component Bud32
MKRNTSFNRDIAIDQACDQYEDYFRKHASYPEMDAFLVSMMASLGDTPVDPTFRSELATEIIRVRISLMQQTSSTIDLTALYHELPGYHREIEVAGKSIRSTEEDTRSENLAVNLDSGQRDSAERSSQSLFQFVLPGSVGTTPNSRDWLGAFELQEHLGKKVMGTVWISSLCDEFATELDSGRNPLIEVYLSRFEQKANGIGDGRDSPCSNMASQEAWSKATNTLFSELLRLEYDYLSKLDSAKSIRHYQDRFPERIETIRHVVSHCWKNRTEIQTRLPLEENIELGNALAAQRRQMLGRYEVLEKIGSGGFGVVFHVYDTTMERDAAIKIPRLTLLDDTTALRRLEAEVNALSRLNHPHIVQAYNAEELDGYFCLVSEYVAGQNLEQWSHENSGKIAIQDALRLVIQIVDAVEHAHSMGVVHRDIKPSNVLISTSKNGEITAKLADFGLAKVLNDKSRTTTTGMLVGTLSYMAPEQLLRKTDGSFSSDIYSIGVLLFGLLAGRVPFSTENELEAISEILERQPEPLDRINGAVSKDLGAVVSKCLQKRASERYRSIQELKSDLQNAAEGRPVSVRPLGVGDRIVHWARSKHRVAEAAWYAVALNLLLVLWSFASLPIHYAGGWFTQDVITSFAGLVACSSFTFTFFLVPSLYAAWRLFRNDIWGARIGIAASFGCFLFVFLILIGVLGIDFGGLYRSTGTRIAVFTLLTLMLGVETLLLAIAYYSMSYSENDKPVKESSTPSVV